MKSFIFLLVLIAVTTNVFSSPSSTINTVKFTSQSTPQSNINYVCPPNLPCEITCTQPNSCYQSIINASLASSLILHCQDQGSCQESTLICPFSGPCNIQCSNLNSCYKSSILGSPSIFHESPYTLRCSAQGSCQESLIRCPANGSCDVSCTNLNSCYKSTFVAGSSGLWSSLTLYCTAQGSCQEAPIQALSSLGHVEIHCNDYNSCYRSNWMISGARLMHLECLGKGSCQNIDLTCPFDGVCDVDCGSLYGACYESNFDAQKSLGFFITCGGQNGCQDSHFNCPVKGTCDINCTADFSCYEMNVKSSYLCLDCDGTQACQDATVGASIHSEVECVGDHACYDVHWSLPPQKEAESTGLPYHCVDSRQQKVQAMQYHNDNKNGNASGTGKTIVKEGVQQVTKWFQEMLKKL